MGDLDTIDVSHIDFESTVFPTDDDMKLWHSLSPAQQRAVIARKVANGLQGPPAQKAGKADIMGEVLAEMKHDL